MTPMSNKVMQIDAYLRHCAGAEKARVLLGELAQQFCDEGTWGIRLEAVMTLHLREDELSEAARQDAREFRDRVFQFYGMEVPE